MSLNKTWSEEEKKIALRMAASGFNYSEIGTRIGRNNAMVRAFFRRNRLRLNKSLLAIRREQNKNNVRFVVPQVSPKPNRRLFDEREARLNEPRTNTMEFCGDPEPSRSALGRFCP